jgi:CBS domain-containing protein
MMPRMCRARAARRAAQEATMFVSDILNEKGRDVLTAKPDQTLSALAATMSERRIGALVVVGAQGRVEGIISERDIVRTIAREGARALDRRASEVMTQRVESCLEADTIQSLMERMTEGRFRHVPVIEGGALVGIVSIGDVVKYRLFEKEAETQAMREYITTA